MLRKRLRNDEDGADDEELVEGGKSKRPGKKEKELKISEMDEWIDSDDESGSDEDEKKGSEDEDDGKKKKKNKSMKEIIFVSNAKKLDIDYVSERIQHSLIKYFRSIAKEEKEEECLRR